MSNPLNNINEPTNPKMNKIIASVHTVGTGMITTGLTMDDHFVIGIGAGLMIVGTFTAILWPSK